MSGRFHFIMTAVWSAAIGVGLALVFSWLWQTEQEESANRAPVDVLETRLAEVTDRVVWIEIRALRRRDCALTATTQWRGPDGIINSRFNPNKAILTPGLERWIRLRMELPDQTPDGHYQVRSVAEYFCPDGKTFVVPTPWLDVALTS